MILSLNNIVSAETNEFKFGLNSTTGTSKVLAYQASLNLNKESDYVINRLELKTSYDSADNQVADDTKNAIYHLEYNTKKIFPFFETSYTDSLAQAIYNRYNIGVGFGYYFVKSPDKYLSVSIGELRSINDTYCTNVSKFEERSRYKFKGDNVPFNITQKFVYEQSSDINRIHGFYNTMAISFKVYKDFSLDVSDDIIYNYVLLNDNITHTINIGVKYEF
jgi:hypothetical protein